MQVLITNGSHSVFIDEADQDDWFARGYYIDSHQIKVDEEAEAKTEDTTEESE